MSYGGITDLDQNDEIKAFIKAVKDQLMATEEKLEMYQGITEYGAEVENDEVKTKTLFGSQFQAGSNYGPDNVQGIIQGTTTLQPTEQENVYSLQCSKTIYSPDVPVDDLYRPVYNARYTSDRNQFGIKHCRVGVVPKGSRKRAEVLEIHPKVKKNTIYKDDKAN